MRVCGEREVRLELRMEGAVEPAEDAVLMRGRAPTGTRETVISVGRPTEDRRLLGVAGI